MFLPHAESATAVGDISFVACVAVQEELARVSPSSRARSFLRPLLPSACYAGYKLVDDVVKLETEDSVVFEGVKEEFVSVVAHEASAGVKTKGPVSKQAPDFAIELESVHSATEVLIQEEILNVIAEDLAAG